MKALPERRRTGPDCLSNAQLDELVCGLATGAAAAEANEHLESCAGCRQRHSELVAFTAEFNRELGDSAILAQVARAPSSRRRRVGARPLVAAAATLCAAALLLLWLRPPAPREGSGVRTKGDHFATVQVLRAGRTFLAGSGAPFYPGDTLQFAIRADRERHVAVFDREVSGSVSVFHPWQGNQSARLPPLESPLESPLEHVLAPSIELDQAIGREWLVIASCDEPFETAEPLRRLAAAPAPAVPAVKASDLALPPSCSVQTFELDKQPGGIR